MLLKFFAVVVSINFCFIHATITSASSSATSNSFYQTIEFVEKCPEGEKCVPYYNCPVDDGDGIFNIRSTIDEETVECESLRTCCEVSLITDELPNFATPQTCGFRNVKGLGYYSEGKHNESHFGEFPWTIALLRTIQVDNYVILIGGGSLIHPQVVLTTAHQIHNMTASELIVRAGEWNSQSIDEMFKHQERYVDVIVRHEYFKKDNLFNDIALLFLEKPFNIEPHVNTICLPQPDFKHDGKKCFSTGWGKIQFQRQGGYQNFLKKVELPVVDKESCQEMLRKTRLGEDFQLNSGFMCAGGQKDIDMCKGDGGGALACSMPGNEEIYYQAGIVAWGISCNLENVPGVYVDVQQYLTWIEQHMADKGFTL